MTSDPLLWIATLSALGLLPFALLTLTCFARISILLLFVRQGLGAGNIPPNIVLNGIALILSAHIMFPVFAMTHDRAQQTLTREDGAWEISHWDQLPVVAEPMIDFLRMNSGEEERASAARIRDSAQPDEEPLTLALAFILTEMQRALEAGVLILLPFLLIDILVALVLLALGAHMLSPTSVSPALKLLLFLSVDGWSLIASGLGDGYILPQ